jgi:outer membrane lipoprotein-sorting protein
MGKQMKHLSAIRWVCLFLGCLISGVGIAETLSLPELLAKTQTGLRAPGLSYRLQAEEKINAEMGAKNYGLITSARFEFLTDGERYRVDKQSMPKDLGENPTFQIQDIVVNDKSINKKLETRDKTKHTGTINSSRNSSPLELTGLLIDKDLLKPEQESVFEKDVTFDPATKLYKIQTLPKGENIFIRYIDPARGYEVVKYEWRKNDKVIQGEDVELQDINGMWAPKTVRHYSLDEAGKMMLDKEISLTALELNPKIDPAAFELEFPQGTEIFDMRDADAVKGREEAMRKQPLDKEINKILKPAVETPQAGNSSAPTPSPAQGNAASAPTPQKEVAPNSQFQMYLLAGLVIPVLLLGFFLFRKFKS